MDFLLRDLLSRIADFLGRRGVEAYLVGGTVRDWLLGHTSQDVDLAVDGDALALARALADELGAAYVPLDEAHATARAVLRAPRGPIRYIDVAGLRGNRLRADLTTRDFTINALAVDLQDAAAGRLQLLDPLEGRKDLDARCLRATSEAAFLDDPLRMLRGIRLAAELGFTIEPTTQQWIAQHAGRIREPSAERVRDELARLFACVGTAGYLRLMDELGLLAPLLPELVACKRVEQPARHQWDVFDHSVVAVDRLDELFDVLELSTRGQQRQPDRHLRQKEVWSTEIHESAQRSLGDFAPQLQAHLQTDLVGGRPRYTLLKFLTLLHDVGKPETQSVDKDGEIHFYEHERVGAGRAAEILGRLHFGAREVKIGRTVVLHHMRPKWLAQSEKVTARAIHRFFRDTRASGIDVALLSLADTLAKAATAPEDAEWQVQLEMTHRLLTAWFQQRDTVVEPAPLVRGGELIQALDLEPGPIVGELLDAIREAQAAGDVTSRAEALAEAKAQLTSSRRQYKC